MLLTKQKKKYNTTISKSKFTLKKHLQSSSIRFQPVWHASAKNQYHCSKLSLFGNEANAANAGDVVADPFAGKRGPAMPLAGAAGNPDI